MRCGAGAGLFSLADALADIRRPRTALCYQKTFGCRDGWLMVGATQSLRDGGLVAHSSNEGG